jgi:hypothetical protein
LATGQNGSDFGGKVETVFGGNFPPAKSLEQKFVPLLVKGYLTLGIYLFLLTVRQYLNSSLYSFDPRLHTSIIKLDTQK